MIELNLLPEDLRKKRKKIEMPEIPFAKIGVFAIIGLVVLQLLINAVIFINQKRLVSLEKKWEEVKPTKEEFDKIKNEISENLKKIRAIRILQEERFNWAPFLNEISNSLTSGIWLTELSYDEKIEKVVAPLSGSARRRRLLGKKTEEKSFMICNLKLSGYASGQGEKATADIGRYIRSLKDNEHLLKFFEDIELVSIKNSIIAGQNVMDFTLACKFKPVELEE